MNVLEKINKIFSFLENSSKTENTELIKQRHIEERAKFADILVDNLKNGKISYDEAVVRAKNFAQNDQVDLAYLMERIAQFEFPLTRQASIQNQYDTEVDNMDGLKQELDLLKRRLPHYANWLENVLKKEGWYMGTGDKIPVDEYDIGVAKEEEKRMNAEIKEGEKIMKENLKRKEEHLRADLNNQSLKTAEKKDSVRESTTVDSSEYDIGVAKEEEKRMNAEIKEGEKIMKENLKKREEYRRAASELFYVKFIKDPKNVKESVWQIYDKKNNQLLVSATLNDIVNNREIDERALNDLQSKEFGNILLEEIGQYGIVETAKNMLGSKFNKLAKENIPEDEENPAEEEDDILEMYGLHTTTPEKEKEVRELEEAGEEPEYYGTEDEDLDVNKLKTEPEDESDKVSFKKDDEELEVLASKYFQWKGILAELKPELLKFAEKSKVKEIGLLVKKAEAKLDEVKDKIESEASPEDINKSLSVAVEAVGTVSDISDLIEKAKGLASDNPELLDILNQIATIIEKEGVSDMGSNIGVGDRLGLPEGFEEDVDTEKTVEEEDIETESEEEVEDEEEKEEDEIEDIEEEEEPKKKEKEESEKEKKSAKLTLIDKMKKYAARDKGDYDVTPKANFEKDFHGDDKAKVKVHNNHFHTIWEIAKELEALGGKKATGKLAKIIADMKKFAESKGINPKDYFNKILEDSEYVNEYFSEKTPDSVINEWKKNTKDTDKAYASIVNKVKLAYKTALEMQEKGLLKKTAEDLNKQIDRFMNMDEASFNAYVESLEAIEPTTTLEDGRFKVSVLDRPTKNGSIIQGYVDNIPVCGISGQDIELVGGRITKASLYKALNLVKTAFENGMFDSVLSNGAIESDGGIDSLGGLNLGTEETKKII